jgi:hypothetical protein
MTANNTYHARDIWKYYSRTLLLQNPEWWGVYKDKIPDYTIYRKYVDEKGRKCVIEIISYKTFMSTLSLLLEKAKFAICEGETFNLLHRMGKICARRVERNHAKRTINYARTRAQNKVWSETKGKFVPAKIIYHTSDDWCRIGWHRVKICAKNQNLYEFKPAKDLRSKKGFNQLLDKALKTKPFLKYKFIYYPLEKRKKHDIPSSIN